jgi:hypothetical protein
VVIKKRRNGCTVHATTCRPGGMKGAQAAPRL